ncbi:MAG: hypothetical protein GF317_18125 [Candidatus Lokiarchaeota archaeon]|nr:hypothetical protein [Candidatus Lokiarchaeota archaeon]MBD3201431.1 hypothetical protein [Candidatus Lokiarchaeota archaeon]
MRSIAKERTYFSSSLRCGICHSNISSTSHIFQSKILHIPVCTRCRHHFPEEDIELMLNMFIAYGGYYGKLSCQDFSLAQIFKSEEFPNETVNQPQQVNIKLLHSALLHGISPRELILQLEEFILD